MIWGSVSDSLRCQQLYIATLSVYIGAFIGLVLPAMQAAGSAWKSTTALGAGSHR
ncbi:hypothetical protein GJ744_000948 [Endocarpon pusillum]|uniref:Uncharacterized protein n=1 Tax=Endocarpon pusillum TaxID=364733 RepID=A0A8H7AE41_9EURO|nr:hypothetical protein GJ744_000948 [Endocarpon pusillum]